MNRPKPVFKSLLLGLFLSFCLTSCSTLLDFVLDWHKCDYPGCNRDARKGSNYCPMHDYNMQKNNFDRSWGNMKEKAARQTKKRPH